MRIAALYDVHGNAPALDAVLAEIGGERCDVTLFGGDIASGPLPRETVELVRSTPNATFVLGNADVLASPAMDARWEAARRWVERQLDSEQIEWLASLPFSASYDDTLFVHANPRDVEAPFHEWTPQSDFEEYAEGVTESRIVTGHVHMQWERRVGARRWICAGSVGMPYEDAPGAYWALLEDGEPTFRRTEYDLERAADAVRSSGHPMADEIADENVLRVPSRDEAHAFFTA